MTRTRVLVVDDSAFARKVLREVLARDGRFEVVGAARDGIDALEKIVELTPDVVTLDLVMPNLDGVGVLRTLPTLGLARPPRVVLVSMTAEDSDLAIAALELGAVDLVQKPTALATDRLYEIAPDLGDVVATAASSVPRFRSPLHSPRTPGAVEPRRERANVDEPRSPPPHRTPRALALTSPLPSPAPAATPLVARRGTRARLLVIGTSTGGPQALTALLPKFPADFPVPVAIALHIPVGYTEALARRLDGASALEVVEAHEGVELAPGRVVLARAGAHLVLREGARDPARLVGHLEHHPLGKAHRPSVDILFGSAATCAGAGVHALVLTGMGDDGLEGARAIRAVGGSVLTESPASSVVDGMPRVVREAGLSDAEAPLPELYALLARRLGLPIEP